MLSVPIWGQSSSSSSPSANPDSASPGTINYIEGQVKIGDQSLNADSVGKVELKAGQSLDTQDGRAEVLLTPGVFLRVGHDSSVQMVSPSLISTKVKVTSGQSTVEVDQLHDQQDLMIAMNDATSYLVHTGFYGFDEQSGFVRIVSGQAVVQQNDRHIRVNGGHEVNVATENATLKSRKFDKSAYEKDSDLYRWSKLRSQYLAEANVNAAPAYYYGWYGPGWWGPGWYWNPWFSTYTFIPGGGVLYSPFGWGFYSPLTVHRAPYSVYGGRVRQFNRGFNSWGMHTFQHPRVPRAAPGRGGSVGRGARGGRR